MLKNGLMSESSWKFIKGCVVSQYLADNSNTHAAQLQASPSPCFLFPLAIFLSSPLLPLQRPLLQDSRVHTDRPTIRTQIKHKLVPAYASIRKGVDAAPGGTARSKWPRTQGGWEVEDGAPSSPGDLALAVGRLEAGGIEADAQGGRWRVKLEECSNDGGGGCVVEGPFLDAETGSVIGDDGDGRVDSVGILIGAGVVGGGFFFGGGFEGWVEYLGEHVGEDGQLDVPCLSGGEDGEADVVVGHQGHLGSVET